MESWVQSIRVPARVGLDWREGAKLWSCQVGDVADHRRVELESSWVGEGVQYGDKISNRGPGGGHTGLELSFGPEENH